MQGLWTWRPEKLLYLLDLTLLWSSQEYASMEAPFFSMVSVIYGWLSGQELYMAVVCFAWAFPFVFCFLGTQRGRVCWREWVADAHPAHRSGVDGPPFS